MDLYDFLYILNSVGKVCLIISACLFFYRFIFLIVAFIKDKPLKETKVFGKYAVLIPARNESKVISKLLQSIQSQNYDKNLIDVYVVVESEDDPTVNIVKSFGYNYFVRKDMDNKRTKGYALDEVVKDIYKKNLKYDAFFIFDADNVIQENFITEMNKLYQSGIEVGFAYRNSVNIHDSWIATCTALLFSNMYTFQNKAKSKFYSHILISGTGYYISHTILDKFQGFPFNSLTEDVECTRYCLLNNIKAKYITSTQFYDEQPNTIQALSNQRLRWIKGFSNVGKKYNKKIAKTFFKKGSNKLAILENSLGIIPNMFFAATFIVYMLLTLGFGIFGLFCRMAVAELYLFNALRAFLFYFLAIDIFTMLQLFAEKDYFRLSKKEVFATLIVNPFYIFSWINSYIKAFFTKDVKWTPIEHTAKEVIKEAPEENVSVETPAEAYFDEDLSIELDKK